MVAGGIEGTNIASTSKDYSKSRREKNRDERMI